MPTGNMLNVEERELFWLITIMLLVLGIFA